MSEQFLMLAHSPILHSSSSPRANGALLKFLQEQCRHNSVVVTQGYISLSDEQKAKLADKFSTFS
jgi:hypothetical protein